MTRAAWQAAELADGGAQRRHGDLGPLGGVGGVLVPEPLHGVAPQEVALRELVVGGGVEVRVGDRVEQHLPEQLDAPALLGHQRQRGGHVATHAVTGHRDAGGVQALARAVGGHPVGDRVVLLDRDRIAGLGREVVLGEDHGGVRADGEFADEAGEGLAATSAAGPTGAA